jgi:hypothetical protein
MSVASGMKDFIAKVFERREPARKAMTEQVATAREELEAATARLGRIADGLEGTIGGMLERNDKVTGRRRR